MTINQVNLQTAIRHTFLIEKSDSLREKVKKVALWVFTVLLAAIPALIAIAVLSRAKRYDPVVPTLPSLQQEELLEAPVPSFPQPEEPVAVVETQTPAVMQPLEKTPKEILTSYYGQPILHIGTVGNIDPKWLDKIQATVLELLFGEDASSIIVAPRITVDMLPYSEWTLDEVNQHKIDILIRRDGAGRNGQKAAYFPVIVQQITNGARAPADVYFNTYPTDNERECGFTPAAAAKLQQVFREKTLARMQ